VNAYLQSYEYVLFEKARNGDTAADLAKKAGFKALEISIRKKMVSLALHTKFIFYCTFVCSK